MKYSIGNGVGKVLTCMTQGQKQWRGDCLREWQLLSGGVQMEENCDNGNIVITKYNLKIKVSSFMLAIAADVFL